MTAPNSSKTFDTTTKSNKDDIKYKIKRGSNFHFYNLLLLIFVSLPVTGVGVINWLIDPQDVFNTPNYLGINNVKPDKDKNDRLFKAIDITRIRPKIIIVGSSRAKQGINPEYTVFDQSAGVYNLALNGPNFYEVRKYIEHAIYNQPDIKEIVLGIDFFMFNAHIDNQPTFSESRLEKKHLTLDDAIKVLFSFDTLNNSKDTVIASKNQKPIDDNYGENGFMPNRNADKPENMWRFNQSIKLYFTLHSNYEFSEQYWLDFAEVVALCQKNNIKLRVFISPSHATHWESIYITNRWKVFEEWKRKIVQLTPVWDFSGYNSVTTESIKNKMDNYVDNSHYTPEIGNLILNRIFNYKTSQVPNDFGVLLTTDNIDFHLENVRQQRQKWVNNNPETVNLVKNHYCSVNQVKC